MEGRGVIDALRPSLVSMITSLPSDIFLYVLPGLDTGLSVGFQIQRASNGTVVQGRTSAGVVERPAGSGNYVISGVAPVEGDTYLIVADWDSGNITPTTSRVEQLKVSMTVDADPTGFGPIADAAKSHLGETFDHLEGSEHFGAVEITRVVERVKRRVMTDPPTTAQEDTLDGLVIDYLGELVALALIEPAFHYYANQHQTVSMGDDPNEVASYPDRIKMLEAMQKWLLADTRKLEADVTPLLASPRLRPAGDGPQIDEPEDFLHVTDDPRQFASFSDFPSSAQTKVLG